MISAPVLLRHQGRRLTQLFVNDVLHQFQRSPMSSLERDFTLHEGNESLWQLDIWETVLFKCSTNVGIDGWVCIHAQHRPQAAAGATEAPS